jgi:hypothetical protein
MLSWLYLSVVKMIGFPEFNLEYRFAKCIVLTPCPILDVSVFYFNIGLQAGESCVR